ncbi:MAG: hypothetical protein GX086_02615 [Alcaligenaceae bacterium]|nr:hypothetical protein [Alcaligenaceae bacterium]
MVPGSDQALGNSFSHIGVIRKVLLGVEYRRRGTILGTTVQHEVFHGIEGCARFNGCCHIRILLQVPIGVER